MKILIISAPRAGSTSLFNGLYKSLHNFKGFCEPFNGGNESLGNSNKEYSLNYSNLLVKLLPWTYFNSKPLPIYFTHSLFQHNYLPFSTFLHYLIEDLIKYSSNFNKIILLRRKNEIESAKSMAYASSNNEYHIPYFYDNTKYDYNEDLNFILNSNKAIENLSNKLNIPITYYEDLFTGNKDNIKDFVLQNQLPISNFEDFYFYLNPKNRYRQN